MQTTTGETATTGQLESQPVTSQSTAVTAVQAVVAVAGVRGSNLWAEDGSLVAQLDSGARMAATARTAASDWLLVTSDGQQGWVQTNAVVIFDQSTLPVASLPAAVSTAGSGETPQLPAAQEEDSNLTANSTAAVTTLLLTAEDAPITTAATTAERSTTIGTVVTTGARLNVRSGPATTYAITAHVANGAAITIIGSSEDGSWLQIQLPEDRTTTGWVAANYVTQSNEVITPGVDAS